jgi:hypothetical protein
MVRVYSAYLSTLTGQTTQAVFSAKIDTAVTTLNVTAVTSGTLAVSQYVTINGVVNQISALVTGTGGTGTYTLATAASSLNSTTQTYITYTYNAPSSKYTPINKYNLNSMTWAVNWREIFGNRNGECRCKVRIISNSSNNLTWLNNVGSIRASFSSSTSNNTNGVNIDFVRPQSDFISTQSYIDCDTTTSDGITILIPTSNNNLSLYLLNSTESPMLNVPDYQIWLYVEVDDKNPYDKKDINQGCSTNIFRPV